MVDVVLVVDVGFGNVAAAPAGAGGKVVGLVVVVVAGCTTIGPDAIAPGDAGTCTCTGVGDVDAGDGDVGAGDVGKDVFVVVGIGRLPAAGIVVDAADV